MVVETVETPPLGMAVVAMVDSLAMGVMVRQAPAVLVLVGQVAVVAVAPRGLTALVAAAAGSAHLVKVLAVPVAQ